MVNLAYIQSAQELRALPSLVPADLRSPAGTAVSRDPREVEILRDLWKWEVPEMEDVKPASRVIRDNALNFVTL